jgi:hypothetical protein
MPVCVFTVRYEHYLQMRNKAISVAGHGGLYGRETSKLPHSSDNRFAGGGKVNFTRLSHFTPREIPGTHFCQRLNRIRAIVRMEGLSQLKYQTNSLEIELATFWL